MVGTRKGGPAVQGDVSGLQLPFVVKHHGVDPSYGVMLDQTIHYQSNNMGPFRKFLPKPQQVRLTYHLPRLTDGRVFVCVSVFGGLLLLDLIHDGVDGEAEAGHAWQIANRDVKLQCAVLPGVLRAPVALTAHRRLTEQLGAMEEPRPHLDLWARTSLLISYWTLLLYIVSEFIV